MLPIVNGIKKFKYLCKNNNSYNILNVKFHRVHSERKNSVHYYRNNIFLFI